MLQLNNRGYERNADLKCLHLNSHQHSDPCPLVQLLMLETSTYLLSSMFVVWKLRFIHLQKK